MTPDILTFLLYVIVAVALFGYWCARSDAKRGHDDDSVFFTAAICSLIWPVAMWGLIGYALGQRSTRNRWTRRRV